MTLSYRLRSAPKKLMPWEPVQTQAPIVVSRIHPQQSSTGSLQTTGWGKTSRPQIFTSRNRQQICCNRWINRCCRRQNRLQTWSTRIHTSLPIARCRSRHRSTNLSSPWKCLSGSLWTWVENNPQTWKEAWAGVMNAWKQEPLIITRQALRAS